MRSRNIKPGFFKNEQLADCEPLARLLFTGLWCMVDRKGRMEYRPRKMKIEILPCDDCDIESLLGQLQRHGFIYRYEVDGQHYLQVVNFDKHQRPHHKEQASTIPEPTLAGMVDASMVQKPGADTNPGTHPPPPVPPDTLIADMRIPESSKDDSRRHTSLSRLAAKDIPPDWTEWTQGEMGWSQDIIQDVWVSFRDYWQSRTGKSAQKSDWGATWRNWCRQQTIRNGGKHAATFNHPSQSTRPSKSERFKHALIDSTHAELGVDGRSGGNQDPL